MAIEIIYLESRDGFDLAFELGSDHYTSPDEFDCYTPKQIAAWREDKWFYGTVTVTASAAGVKLGSDSLGGVEFGTYPITDENDNLEKWVSIWASDLAKDYADDLIAGALEQARITINKINEQIGIRK